MAIDHSFHVRGRSLVGDTFIETGFFRGDTAVAAHRAGFRVVHSVEVGQGLYEAGLERLRRENLVDRVLLHHGPSPDVLPRIMDPRVATTFYLDGHFSGDTESATDPVYGECPIIAELAAIFKVPWATRPIIVIDDASMYHRPWNDDLNARFDSDQWPLRDQIDAFLPGYQFEEQNDTLYAWPL